MGLNSFCRTLRRLNLSKFCAVFVCAAVLMSLCACNIGDKDTTSSSETTASSKTSATTDSSKTTETVITTADESSELSTGESSGVTSESSATSGTSDDITTQTTKIQSSSNATASVPSTKKTTVKTTAKTTVKTTAKTTANQGSTATAKTTAKTTVKATAKTTVKTTVKPTSKVTTTAVPVTPGVFETYSLTPIFSAGFSEPVNFIEEKGVSVDMSHLTNGILRVALPGVTKNLKTKVLINKDGKSYQYTLYGGCAYMELPFNLGSGSYTVEIWTNVTGSTYVKAMGQSMDVQIANALQPYVNSSQIVYFRKDSNTTKKATELAAKSSTVMGKIDQIYKWIVASFSYDYAKAKTVPNGYIPTPDSTLASKTGICYDYAAVYGAMLRSLGIPTRLVMGYVQSGGKQVYHAWNEVYFKGKGWVVVAQFKLTEVNGEKTVRFDTTFASGGINPTDIIKNAYSTLHIY